MEPRRKDLVLAWIEALWQGKMEENVNLFASQVSGTNKVACAKGAQATRRW
jgi:hypothetical protein